MGQLRQVVGVVAPRARDGVPAAGALEVRQVVRGEDRGGAGGLLDGLAEAGAPGEVQYAVVADGVGDQPGGVVGAAGVGGHDGLDGALLAEQPGERVGQPAGAVVGDEDRGHHVTRELGRLGRVEHGRVRRVERCGGGRLLGTAEWLCTDIEVRAPVRWTAVDARGWWERRGVSDERPH